MDRFAPAYPSRRAPGIVAIGIRFLKRFFGRDDGPSRIYDRESPESTPTTIPSGESETSRPRSDVIETAFRQPLVDAER
jgi:hypothetical protein